MAAENFGNWDLAELRIPAEPSLLEQTTMPMTTSGRCEWQTSQFDFRLGRRTVSAVCSRDVPNADYDEAIADTTDHSGRVETVY